MVDISISTKRIITKFGKEAHLVELTYLLLIQHALVMSSI